MAEKNRDGTLNLSVFCVIQEVDGGRLGDVVNLGTEAVLVGDVVDGDQLALG